MVTRRRKDNRRFLCPMASKMVTMMQNEFKADLRHENTPSGAIPQNENNRSNLGASRPVTQKSFAISETTARLLLFCVEIDMLLEDLDLTVEGITNDESHMEKIAMDVTRIKDIVLTRFLVPNIEMNLGSRADCSHE